jgi:predicted  nucleic acid-binding Zn-ribbon protein
MSGFACVECGHKFKTVKAAEKAAYSDAGCPKCGGSDIDLAAAEPKKAGTK